MKLLKSAVIATALSASLVAPAIANESSNVSVAQFSATDMQQMFEQDAGPMQVAALSRTEMKETEGALLNLLLGGGAGLGMYVVDHIYNGTPMTWQGATFATVTGAITGGIGSKLISLSGGGIAGNVAWRPGVTAFNNGLNQYVGHRNW